MHGNTQTKLETYSETVYYQLQTIRFRKHSAKMLLQGLCALRAILIRSSVLNRLTMSLPAAIHTQEHITQVFSTFCVRKLKTGNLRMTMRTWRFVKGTYCALRHVCTQFEHREIWLYLGFFETVGTVMQKTLVPVDKEIEVQTIFALVSESSVDYYALRVLNY